MFYPYTTVRKCEMLYTNISRKWVDFIKMRKLFPIHSKYFGARLKALMDYNNLNSLDLAVKLCGYTVKPKSSTKEYEECRNKRKTIDNHLKLKALKDLKSSESLSTLYLIEYCNFFNCEADYLLGYIDFPTKQTQDIYELTGLNEKSIETLKILKRSEYIGILNYIMSDYAILGRFLSNLSLYFDNDYDTPVHYDKKLGICVESDDITDSPIISTNGEKYVSIGKKLDYDVCGNPAYSTIHVPVSILESHALHCIQAQIDDWKQNYNKE